MEAANITPAAQLAIKFEPQVVEALETAKVWANCMVGLGAPLTVTVEMGALLDATAPVAAVPLLKIMNRGDIEYMELSSELRNIRK